MLKQAILFAFLASIAAAIVFKSPLQRHESKNYLSSRLKTVEFKVDRHDSRLSKVKTPMTDYANSFYVFNVTVGTPPQQFRILLDTGNADFWLIGRNCTQGDCDGIENPELGNQKFPKSKYDETLSSTYKPDGRGYETFMGMELGTLVGDTLDFGGGLKVATQTFGALQDLIGFYAYWPIDGLIGFGGKRLAENPDTYVFDNIKSQLDAPVFTIFLNKLPAVIGGELTLGGVDNDNCEANIVYTPKFTDKDWLFNVNGFSFGNYKHSKTQTSIVDTGYPFIEGPDNEIAKIAKKAGASYDPDFGHYTIDCNAKVPDLTFTIAGKQLSVASNEFILDWSLTSGKCAFALNDNVGVFNNMDWIFGSPFYRSFCVTHDFGKSQIGFAKTKA